MSVDVTPEDVGSAAKVFFGCQSDINQAWDTLKSTLDGQSGMAGNGDPATIFAAKYQRGVGAAWDGLTAAVLTLGGMSLGLTSTANNYIRAEHASTAGKNTPAPPLLSPQPVISGIEVPLPASPVGASASWLPSFLKKYDFNADLDKLRTAAAAWFSIRDIVADIGSKLHTAVSGVIESNNSACLDAMNDFWSRVWTPGDTRSVLFGLHEICHFTGHVCDAYGQAVSDARGDISNALIGASLALGGTDLLGGLGTIVTGGASDVGAAVADAAEAAAIIGPAYDRGVANVTRSVDGALADDLIATVENSAKAVPDVDTIEADTTDIQAAVDQSLTDNGPTPDSNIKTSDYAQQVPTFDATNFRNQQTADIHFAGTSRKSGHGADFGSASTDAYVRGAQQFLKQAQADHYPAKIDATGCVRIYDPTTNTFGVFNTDGTIVTYYKPSSPTYWERNSPDWGADVQWQK